MKDSKKGEERIHEWKDKYNSFNSNKGLTWMDSHYRPIAKWFKKEGKLPPPIELSLDPAHLCNFKCGHCNAQRYLVHNPKEVPVDKKIMTRQHLERLIDFSSEWGIRGVCIGGGGEPLMNKNVWTLPSYITKRGLQSSFATNGSLINEEIAEEMMNCRWVGVSVDSGTKKTFERIHGVDKFDQVINNLKLLVEKKKESDSEIDIAYKFLIRPDNWQDLYLACTIAKDLGVRDFHARPVDLERKDFSSAVQLNYDIEGILKMFNKCHQLEEGNEFRVFTIIHKYDPKFRVEHTFKNCVSSSLMLQACSDGNAYVCADHRLEKRFRLTSHHPDPNQIKNYWGDKKHRKLLQSINVDKECARCTYGVYAEQIERLAMEIYEKDSMCLNFP